MKAILLISLSLYLASDIVAVAQSPLNQATQVHHAAGSRLSTIMGVVRADGQTLTFVTDQRAWNVDNPEVIKGHEGHYVRVTAHVHPDKDSIHITEVKLPTANESRRNDLR
jgi:hypothetical protein